MMSSIHCKYKQFHSTVHTAEERRKITSLISLLTPVPVVIGGDERLPLFHSPRYRLCPEMTSLILKFCRRKRSFQWYPIRVIRSIEPEIRTRMLRNFSEKLGAKFPSNTIGHCMVIIARLYDAFSGILGELEASPISKFWFGGMPEQNCHKTRC